MRVWFWNIIALGFTSGLLRAQDPFELKEGDRLVLLGGTFIEREQVFGHLETFLHAQWPDRKFTIRNLGWSGDTVFCPARSYFGPPKEGFERLEKNLAEIKPTVILSCYGAVEAYQGEEGLKDFMTGYGVLLDMLAKTGARLVLMSPPPLENLPSPLPNQDAQNRRVSLYRDAIARIASQRGNYFADLFATLGEGRNANLKPPLTENGLHFTNEGYAKIVQAFAISLGLAAPRLGIWLDAKSGTVEAVGATTSSQRQGDAWKIEVNPLVLTEELVLGLTGAPPGDYTAKLGDDVIMTASQQVWANGLALTPSGMRQRSRELRRTIGEKNERFFHRWRPANETYLFGFRKHEQGNNAVEIPRFDPLVSAKDEAINAGKKLGSFTITVSKKNPSQP